LQKEAVLARDDRIMSGKQYVQGKTKP